MPSKHKLVKTFPIASTGHSSKSVAPCTTESKFQPLFLYFRGESRRQPAIMTAIKSIKMRESVETTLAGQ